jgi:hypothetical protein
MHLIVVLGIQIAVAEDGAGKVFPVVTLPPGRCCVDVSSLRREKSHKLWLSLEDGVGKLFILLTFYPCRCCVDVSSLSREKSHKLWLSLEDGAGKLFIILTVSATTGELTVLNKKFQSSTNKSFFLLQSFKC